MNRREIMNKKVTDWLMTFGILLMSIPVSLFGQMTARSMGMGGAYMGVGIFFFNSVLRRRDR